MVYIWVMNELFKIYSEFLDLLKEKGMGWEHETITNNGIVVLSVSFWFLNTNYKEVGCVVNTYLYEDGIIDLQIRNFTQCLNMLKDIKLPLTSDPPVRPVSS